VDLDLDDPKQRRNVRKILKRQNAVDIDVELTPYEAD